MPVVVVGTSISDAGWLPDPAHTGIWSAVNARLRALGYRPMANHSLGGMAIRNPATGASPALEHIKTVIGAMSVKPAAVVLELGANDWSTHTAWSNGAAGTDLGYCAIMADTIGAWLTQQGIDPIWCTGMPVANSFRCGTHQPAGMRALGNGRLYLIGPGTGINSLEPMNAKITAWNDWLWLSADRGGKKVADIWSPLQPDSSGNGDPALFLDGLHPNATGSALIAQSFPVGVLLPYLEVL